MALRNVHEITCTSYSLSLRERPALSSVEGVGVRGLKLLKLFRARYLAEFFPSHFIRLAVLLILGMGNSPVSLADIEPRSYANIPVGINFLLAGYSYMNGNVAFAPTLPIDNAKLETHSSVFAYVRSLDIWGKSGKVDMIIPEAWLSGQAEVSGQPQDRQIAGFADPLFRFYVNLYGAPALSMKEFAKYQQDTISA